MHEVRRVSGAGGVIIDGGNTFYKDDIRNAKETRARAYHYVDCGTSGGVWGIERGYCLMIGGVTQAVDRLDPIFSALAPGTGDDSRTPGREQGDSAPSAATSTPALPAPDTSSRWCTTASSMALMQAYAEGFDILRNKHSKDLPEDERFELNVTDIAEVWRRGSVISSWLFDLGGVALAKDPQLKASPALFRIPARAAGRSKRRSRKPCRQRCFPLRFMPASARVTSIPSAKRCSRRCASDSAAMSRRAVLPQANRSRKADGALYSSLKGQRAYRSLFGQTEQFVALRIEQPRRVWIAAGLQNLNAIETHWRAIELIEIIPPGARRLRSRDIPHFAHSLNSTLHLNFVIYTAGTCKIDANADAVILNKELMEVANPHIFSSCFISFCRLMPSSSLRLQSQYGNQLKP